MSRRSHAVFGRALVLVLCFSLGQAQQQSQVEVEAQEVAQGQGPIVYHARIRPGQANQGANSATIVTEAPEVEAPEGQTVPLVVQVGGPNSPGGAISTYPPNYEYEAPETPEGTSPLPTTGASVPETPPQTVVSVPRRQPSYNQQQARGTAGSVSASGQSTPATFAGHQRRHQILTQATNAAKTHLMRNLFEQFRKMAEYHQYDMQKMRAAMQKSASPSVSGQRGAPVYDPRLRSRHTSTSGKSMASVYDAGQGTMQTSTSGQSGKSVYHAGQGSVQASTSGQSRTSVYDAGQGSVQTSTPSPILVPVYLAGRWTKQKYNPSQPEVPVYAGGQGNIQTSTPHQLGYERSTGTQPPVTAAPTSSQPLKQTTFQTGAQYSDVTGAQTPVNGKTDAQTTTSAPLQVGAQTPPSVFQLVEHLSKVYPRSKTDVSGQATTQTAPAAGQVRSTATDQTPVAIKEIVPVKTVENSVNAKLSHPLEPRFSSVPSDPYTGTGNMLKPITNAEFGAIMQRMLVQRLRKYISSQRKFPAYNPGP